MKRYFTIFAIVFLFGSLFVLTGCRFEFCGNYCYASGMHYDINSFLNACVQFCNCECDGINCSRDNSLIWRNKVVRPAIEGYDFDFQYEIRANGSDIIVEADISMNELFTVYGEQNADRLYMQYELFLESDGNVIAVLRGTDSKTFQIANGYTPVNPDSYDLVLLQPISGSVTCRLNYVRGMVNEKFDDIDGDYIPSYPDFYDPVETPNQTQDPGQSTELPSDLRAYWESFCQKYGLVYLDSVNEKICTLNGHDYFKSYSGWAVGAYYVSTSGQTVPILIGSSISAVSYFSIENPQNKSNAYGVFSISDTNYYYSLNEISESGIYMTEELYCIQDGAQISTEQAISTILTLFHEYLQNPGA